MVTFNSVKDLESPTGPITKNLKVTLKLTSSKDIQSTDSFDIDIKIHLKIYVFLGYVPALPFVYNKIGAAIGNKNVTYMGDG